MVYRNTIVEEKYNKYRAIFFIRGRLVWFNRYGALFANER